MASRLEDVAPEDTPEVRELSVEAALELIRYQLVSSKTKQDKSTIVVVILCKQNIDFKEVMKWRTRRPGVNFIIYQ